MYYAAQDPGKELYLAETYGGFTVESAKISRDLESVTFFCTETGIIFGIGFKSAMGFQHIGLIENLVEYQFDINGPSEVIKEIAVETASGGGRDLVAMVFISI